MKTHIEKKIRIKKTSLKNEYTHLKKKIRIKKNFFKE